MTYRDLLVALISSCEYTRVLELGALNFACARALLKGCPGLSLTCVDHRRKGATPEGVTFHLSTTDDFFATNTESFDFVFVDAGHEAEQVYRDILSAVDCLEVGGTVAVHDIDPKAPHWGLQQFCGDGYKILPRLEGLDVVVLPVANTGLALIRKPGDTRVSQWA